MSASIKYAVSTSGRIIFLALKLVFCEQCTEPILRGQLFTRGLPGAGQANVCYECRPFEVDEREINPNWQDNSRPEVDFVEI